MFELWDVKSLDCVGELNFVALQRPVGIMWWRNREVKVEVKVKVKVKRGEGIR